MPFLLSVARAKLRRAHWAGPRAVMRRMEYHSKLASIRRNTPRLRVPGLLLQTSFLLQVTRANSAFRLVVMKHSELEIEPLATCLTAHGQNFRHEPLRAEAADQPVDIKSRELIASGRFARALEDHSRRFDGCQCPGGKSRIAIRHDAPIAVGNCTRPRRRAVVHSTVGRIRRTFAPLQTRVPAGDANSKRANRPALRRRVGSHKVTRSGARKHLGRPSGSLDGATAPCLSGF